MKSWVYHLIYGVIIACLIWMVFYFQHKTQELSKSLSMIQRRIDQTKKELDIERAVRRRQEEARKKVVPSALKPKVAIVLDDWGYNLKNFEVASNLGCPITFSILPNLPYSRRIAVAAMESGNEVILHLPLEPYEDLPLEKDTITTAMTEKEAAKIFDNQVASMPEITGISNHMGSKATEDKRVMTPIFKRMKKRGLYYLDSVVTSKSVAGELCGGIGVRFAARSVFLDNELSTEHVKKQVEELARVAREKGSAVGVGHDRAVTIAVLAEMLPRLQEMGIEIVPVSKIAK